MKSWKPKKIFIIILFSLSVVLILSVFLINIQDKKLSKYEDRIKRLEELVTARQIYRNVIYSEVRENLIVDKRTLFSINYNITAGVDFSKGLEIKSNNNRIIVKYPYPEILSIDADESSIDQYFALERFGKLKQSDYLGIIYNEKERIGEDAINGGILERADKNLRVLISGLLREGGINNTVFDSFKKDAVFE